MYGTRDEPENNAPRVLVWKKETRPLVCCLANETGNRNDALRVLVCHKARD